MSKKFTIIGSGAAAVNAALTLLEKNYQVTIIDYGYNNDLTVNYNTNFNDIKRNFNYSSKFFYGNNLEGINNYEENVIFKYPKSRQSISHSNLYDYDFNTTEFEPIFGNATGGLATGWGANSVEFSNDDLEGFGFTENDIQQGYIEAYKRLNISGPLAPDDLTYLVSQNATFSSSLKISEIDLLINKISHWYRYILRDKSVILGQSRLAIKSSNFNKCENCGLCIWGCPYGSIYNPIETLNLCKKYKNFSYLNNCKVLFFQSNNIENKIKYLIVEKEEKIIKIEVSNVILAAGAINSCLILLRSFKENNIIKSNTIRSVGLLDTEVVKLPFIFIPSLFKPFESLKVQFNGLIAMIKNNNPIYPKWIQAEIMSLGSLIYHPLLKKIPFGIKNSLIIFNYIKNMLCVATIFMPDINNGRKYIEMKFLYDKISVKYVYSKNENENLIKNEIVNKLKKHLRFIGALTTLKSAIHFKHGAGIHYAGTIPISLNKKIGCVDSDCKSYDFKNLHVVDGSVFPSLPSKSITMTIIANSIRVCNKL